MQINTQIRNKIKVALKLCCIVKKEKFPGTINIVKEIIALITKDIAAILKSSKTNIQEYFQ